MVPQHWRQRQRATAPISRICVSTLAWLKARGELVETDKQVDPDLEVTGLQKLMDGGCPVLFNNVKGKPNHRVLTNLFGDIKVVNAMFGWANDKERTRKLARALVEAAAAAGDCAVGSAVPGGGDRKAERRERISGADPPYRAGEGADRRLRHPLRLRRGVRRRHRRRLQPHEFPLGQCRHVPDLARLAHVAGGERGLSAQREGAADVLLRRAAGLHAARRRARSTM